MKIATWNVNDLKAITRKGSLDEVLKYDVAMLQEIRTSDKPLDLLFSDFAIGVFLHKEKGYGGVMTIIR
ncbi:hypothetical protein [Acidianus sp. HS-5]|uniref:hypothetical protein n=1 Tax=Acidianus sp. HS-5 TaxID=2886040 RepID=UPI001F2EE221|nr:hypothetical protein [Acidianus sp. HS-5]BDC17692.1 hypothetical protein HS5_05820 [Acidianus sp. HS-5]